MTHAVSAILAHTPLGVWITLAVLVSMGITQTRTRDVSAQRVWLMPLALGAWSLWGALHAFDAAGELVTATGWLAGVALGMAANLKLDLPRQVTANPDGSFRIGGSLAPLLLFVGVFALRYVVGAALAIAPALSADPAAALVAAAAYGFTAGLLVARSRKIWATRAATRSLVTA